MKQDKNLTDKNFLLYCSQNYLSPRLDDEEFLSDLKRIKYIKKLLSRFEETGDLKERLILNHIVVLQNVFGHKIAVNILYLKLSNYFSYIIPFLIFLDICPQILYNIGDKDIIHLDQYYPLNNYIIEKLRNISNEAV